MVVQSGKMDDILETFQWEIGDTSSIQIKLRQEAAQLEAANIHSIISSEEQSNKVIKQIDASTRELEAIDDWLNHYTLVLDSMGADVHNVEVQNKSLQMAGTNQKLLLNQLESLLSSLKIPAYIIEILKNEPLQFADGVLQCEEAVNKLTDFIKSKFDDGVSEMAAVKERVALFQSHANEFAQRLYSYLTNYFKHTAESYLNDESRYSRKGQLKLLPHDTFEEKIYRFRRLLVWLKEVDARKLNELQMTYTSELARVYSKELHELFDQIRLHLSSKMSNQDQDHLFVVAPSNVATAVASNVIEKGAKSVLKLKGGMTMKKIGKGSFDDEKLKRRNSERDLNKLAASGGTVESDELRSNPEVVFGEALTLIVAQIIREQNLIMDVFAMKPLSPDQPPPTLKEWQAELVVKTGEPIRDVKIERKITDMMGLLFDNLKEEMTSIMELCVKYDQSVSLGMASKIEEAMVEIESTSNSWLYNVMNTGHKKLLSIFTKFIEEQQKNIEESKITARKRTGVLPVYSTFPLFLDKLESYITTDNSPITRQHVHSGYETIIKTLFKELDDVIAEVNENTDEKEQVNAHILAIENMHFLHGEVRSRRVHALDQYVKQAKATYDANLSAYCKFVIRKPLGKLLEFFEGIQLSLKTQRADEISFNLSYSKTALKEVVKKYPLKEITKGLESLYRRVDRHFTDEDEGRGQLLQVVWRGIQEEVVSNLRSYEELILRCYPDSGIHLEFSVEEVLVCFSDLAKQ